MNSIKPVAIHLLSALSIFVVAVIAGTLFSSTTLTPPSSPSMLASTAALPDLIVTDIQMSPAMPMVGQAVIFSATIKNQGSIATPEGVQNDVGFAIDGTAVVWSHDNTSSIAPGGSVTITANSGSSGAAWTATLGTHTLNAWVNDAIRYTEVTMSNNQLQKSFTVVAASGGTTATQPSPSPSPTTMTSTSGSPSPSPTPTTAAPQPTISGIPVTFSVVVATGAESLHCDKGYPQTEVYFGSDPIYGGEFYLQSTTGFSAKFEPGIYPFPNGTYHWIGDARSGYTRSGTYENSFTLNAHCEETGTTTSGTVEHTNTTSPITTTVTTNTTTSAPVLSSTHPQDAVTPTETSTKVDHTTTPVPLPAPSTSGKTTKPEVHASPANEVKEKAPEAAPTPEVVQVLSSCDTSETCAKVCTDQSCGRFVQTEIAPAPAPTPSSGEATTGTGGSVPLLDERVGARAFVDTDGDGISDYDEVNIYHTNPNLKDTDKDGVFDGDEILARTDPSMSNTVEAPNLPGTTTTGTATIAPLAFTADPRESGVITPTLLRVENIVPLSPPENTATSTKVLRLTGHTLPNSFITIYVFSTPIVVVLKADDTGAWTYTLDKELPDGAHEVYSAITDASGKVIAKSEPLPFVKEAQALTIGVNGAPAQPSEVAPSFFSGMPIYASILMLVGILGIALTIIGLIVRRRGDEPPLGTL